jgi:hypothetical protein
MSNEKTSLGGVLVVREVRERRRCIFSIRLAQHLLVYMQDWEVFGDLDACTSGFETSDDGDGGS